MDASKLKAAARSTFHVKSVTGEPLFDDGDINKPVRITMHGPGTRAASIVKSRQTARTLKRMQDNDGKVTAPTADETLAERAEDLATMTIAFENLSHGELAGAELFEAVYGDPELGYIAEQADKHWSGWGNFKPGSPAS